MATKAKACETSGQSKFRDAIRVQRAVTGSLEQKILHWLAQRTPRWVSPDHLTVLGFAAQFLAGLCYALARWNRASVIAATFFIALNWLGDSLDGTLARYRMQLRPRYGFYVDHMIDSFGAVALMIGLATSGYLHWEIAAAMLIAFLVLSIETYLAAYTLSDFRLSHGPFGPTEIRILLATGNVAVLFWPGVHLIGRDLRLFDIGGAIGAAGMIGMAVIAGYRHTVQLYNEERLT